METTETELQLNAWTVPRDGSRRDAHIVFSHPLDSKNGRHLDRDDDFRASGEGFEPSRRRRALQAQWAKEDEADAKRFARNAA